MNTAQLIARAVNDPRPDTEFPLKAWRAYAQNRAAIHAALDTLEPAHLSLFTALVKKTGPLPFDWNKLDQWHHMNLPSAYIRALIPTLQRLGLLATLRKAWGEQIFAVPSDIYEVMIERLIQASQQDLAAAEELHGAALQLQPLAELDSVEAGEGLIASVFRLVIRTAKEGLPITAKGLLHKKTMQRMEQDVILPETPLSVFKVPRMHPDSMSAGASMMLDVSLRLGLITKVTSEYALVSEVVEEWLSQSFLEWRRALFQIVSEHYMPAEVSIKHMMLGLAAAGHTHKWQCASTVISMLRQHGWYKQENQTDINDCEEYYSWLRAAQAIGLCDAGEDSSGRVWYRWHAALSQSELDEQNQHACFFVQPDFEVMVPPNSSLLMRWELEMMAERGASTPMLTYRLTRASCQQAIEHGRDLAWQVAFLEQHAMTEIPDHVRAALQQWASQYGKVHFAEVMLLRASDAAASALIAKELASDPAEGLIAIGPLDYIVERSKIDGLRSRLDQLGLTPLRKVDSLDNELSMNPSFPIYWRPVQDENAMSSSLMNGQTGEAESILLGKGKVYSPSALQYYEMDTNILEDDVLAQFRQLPAMWTNSVRSYHSSTMRELVDTAIRCQLPMLIKDHFLGEITVLPLSTVDTSAPAGVDPASWSVCVEREVDEGVESIILTTDTWDGVRVLLPGWLER